LAYLEAFERALSFYPNDASLHLEFARGLYGAYFSPDSNYMRDTLANELATVLKLDPGNADALSMLGNLQINSSDLPTPGPFPTRGLPTPTEEMYLTPTITPYIVTEGPTGTPVLSETPAPTLPAVPPTSAAGGKSSSTGLLLLAGLATLGIGFGAGWLLRRK
jgi:hypothetical protein